METTLTIRISKEIKEKADKLAKKRGYNLSTMIRTYLIQEIEKEEKKGEDK